MITVTADVLSDRVFAVMKAANIAGGNVFPLRAWPTQQEQLPLVKLDLPIEDKESIGPNGAQQFIVVAEIPVIIQVSDGAQPDDGAANDVRLQLLELQRAVEISVINNPEIRQLIQEITHVRVRPRLTSAGAPIFGQRVMTFGFQFYQGPEDFFRAPTVPLREVQIRTSAADFQHLDTQPSAPALDIDLPT